MRLTEQASLEVQSKVKYCSEFGWSSAYNNTCQHQSYWLWLLPCVFSIFGWSGTACIKSADKQHETQIKLPRGYLEDHSQCSRRRHSSPRLDCSRGRGHDGTDPAAAAAAASAFPFCFPHYPPRAAGEAAKWTRGQILSSSPERRPPLRRVGHRRS